jgi:hypothetical protein
MGTRLYPNTTDRAALEVLARVPSGTHDRMTEMAKRHDAERAAATAWNEYEDGYRQWKERDSDGPIGDLDGFLTFGWGKFRPVDGIGEDCAGHEDDLSRAARLLQANGIGVDVALTGGLHWS